MNSSHKILRQRVRVQIWVLAITQGILTQVPYDMIWREQALDQAEQIVLFTDRNMYAVNERIYFRSFYIKGPEKNKEAFSKLLYVELVTPSGMAVAKRKYHLDREGSSGYLPVPADAMTGNYFLRCYTRWMRNFSPRNFCYIPLKIINPYHQNVLNEASESSTGRLERDLMNFGGPVCKTSKQIYSPGEEVKIDLFMPETGNSFAEGFCLTVVPAGFADTLYSCIKTDDPGEKPEFRFDYLPDIRGVSISGNVIGNEDHSPVPSARLHFSLLGDRPDYLPAVTDEMGRFVLTLPDMTGIQELFVACDFPEGTGGEIRIDQDFSSDPVPLAAEPFTLTPEENAIATRMAVNMQLSMAYSPDETNPSDETPDDVFLPFYGLPSTRIEMDKFIDLPTLTEVFENLVPDVFFYLRQGEPYLNIESRNNMITLFPPLILLDHIHVSDQKAVLSIDPDNIKLIDVINEVYVRGDMMFGGIIQVTTKKADLASIDLPRGSFFLDYQVYHPGDLRSPGYVGVVDENRPGDKIPDTRNTLLWIGHIRLSSQEHKTLRFPAAPRTGKYHVLVRGVSSTGETAYVLESFMVE